MKYGGLRFFRVTKIVENYHSQCVPSWKWSELAEVNMIVMSVKGIT